MKPTKCPAREKKMRQEKRKKREGEKAKSKSQDCCVTFIPKNYLEILLFAHARTTQADIFASGSEGREVCDLWTGLW